MSSLNVKKRSLRAEQAAMTRARILDAATALFDEHGYSQTTIEAVAERAGVAVETVYSRFRNKPNIVKAILEPAVSFGPDPAEFLNLPAIVEIRALSDHAEQLRRLAGFSRSILERTACIHRIMSSAAATDAAAAEIAAADDEHRVSMQRLYIDILLAAGPLRPQITPEEAADTYSALANPRTYAFLVEQRGWTPDRFEEWLADSLTKLLIDGGARVVS